MWGAVSTICSRLHAELFVQLPSRLFSRRLVRVQVVQPYSSTDITTAWKNCRFNLSVRSDFYLTDNLLVAAHAFPIRVLTSLSVDEILLPRYVLKNAACGLEQIVETAPHKETAICPPAPHLTNHPSETDETCRTLLEKQGRAHKRRSPVEANTWICKCGAPSKDLH